MIRIDARQLARLCACHFISQFDYADLHSERYVSDYVTSLDGIPLSLWCEAHFSSNHAQVTAFAFDMYSPLNEERIEITGSYWEGTLKAIDIINDYLNHYQTEKFPEELTEAPFLSEN